MLYAFTCFLISIFARFFFRLCVTGAENLPRHGGVIIAANHLSYLDIPLLGYSLNREGRPADFMGKKELFMIPLVGLLFRMLRGFPIDREKMDRAALREAIKRLQAGRVVVIYPEGTRSRDGRLQPGRPGIGMIVKMSGAKVVPVAIQGTDKAMPVGQWFPVPARVTIKVGSPLDFSALLKKEGEKEDIEKITGAIMENIAALLENK